MAITLLTSIVQFADAASTPSTVEKLSSKMYKHTNTQFFKVCSGSQSLAGAGVLITSKIDAVPYKLPLIPPNNCHTFSQSVNHLDSANIKAQLVLPDKVVAMKDSLRGKISDLKSTVTSMEMNLPPGGPNNSIGKLNNKIVGEMISEINVLKSELKIAQAKLNALNLLF